MNKKITHPIIKKDISTDKQDIFYLKMPVLFEIPLYDYADEVNRKRNKSWYLKMKRLEKKSQDLREKLTYYTERKSLMIERTQALVAFTASVNNKYYNRKLSR